MGKGRRYNQEYKDMIVDLFKSGISLTEHYHKYGIARSTINGYAFGKRMTNDLVAKALKNAILKEIWQSYIVAALLLTL